MALSNILSALAADEDKRRVDLEDKFTEWATILQGVDGQFKKIYDLFSQVQHATKSSWALNEEKYKEEDQLGNGYVFEVELVKTTAHYGPPRIQFEYAARTMQEGLNGKYTYYGLGNEEDIGIPIGFGLRYDKLSQANLKKFLSSRKDYDLSEFYASASELTGMHTKALNHMVCVAVTTKECSRHYAQIPVYDFIKMDVEPLIEELLSAIEHDVVKNNPTISGYLVN
ncbi:MAG: hypothetical protein HGA85_00550 [Nanoarchaeota archaeon]|nr:hypothetical protein [Nanoarchaeota archaeon]